MSKIRVLIVEDDPGFALEAEMLVDELGYELIDSVDNSRDAVELIHSSKPDVILMDVFPKGKLTGIEIAEKVKNLMIPVIFFTAYPDQQLYERAKNIRPVAYLIKPFDKLTLQSSIELAISRLGHLTESVDTVKGWLEDIILKDCLFIKSNNVLKKVLIADVLWLQSDGNYCIINTKNKKYILKKSLSRIMEKLPKQSFIQVHRSYIVQTSYIEDINLSQNELRVANQNIPLGRSYKDNLLNNLNLL